MDNQYWIHDLSPFIFQIGSFGLRWYGMAYLAGLVVGWWFALRWFAKGRFPMNGKDVADAVLYIGVGMIAGGRLAYCIFYYTTFGPDGVIDAPPMALIKDPLYLFKLWEGGMASHGGIVGMFVGALVFCRKRRIKLFVLGDAIAATAGFGVLFGRLANFINGELWGRATDVSWAVYFPASINVNLQTTPLTDELRNYIVTTAVPRHPSQLYAAVLEGALVAAITLVVHRYHRRPGLSMATAIMVYAIGRFVGEFWREPDPGYELIFGWMSKGQMLTLPFVAVSAFFAIYAFRRPPQLDAYLPPPPLEPEPAEKGAA